MFTQGTYDISEVWESLARDGERIVMIVMDGAGGLRHPEIERTALEAANTPNLDRLTLGGSCGLLELVGPGITPGSGPGHLALFGYDPIRHKLGRGVLSALGIDFHLNEGDVAARVNFATLAPDGTVEDRRAGRIPTELNRRLCSKIREHVRLPFDGEYFFEPEAEHRAVFVLRGAGLGGRVTDTDPQLTGQLPLAPRGEDEESGHTASLVQSFLEQAQAVLSDERPANGLLLRGFQRFAPFRTLQQRFKLDGLCIAQYPMYRGVGRLLGMEIAPTPATMGAAFDTLATRYNDGHDFFFLHLKTADSRGEDADFEGKVEAIEEMDRHLRTIRELDPDVLVVTADHSTPAIMGVHSWHPVPLLIRADTARVDDVIRFDEYSCARGTLGLRPGLHAMGLALAHAGRLKKYGA